MQKKNHNGCQRCFGKDVVPRRDIPNEKDCEVICSKCGRVAFLAVNPERYYGKATCKLNEGCRKKS